MFILVNERFMERKDVNIDLEDRGYQFGDGIYEVVRVYNGKLFRLDDHMTRFERSANELKMVLPLPINEIKEKFIQLVEKNQLQDGIIYAQITRGVASRNHSFPHDTKALLTGYTKDYERPLKDFDGIKVVTTEDIRWLRCDIKTINLLGNVLAKQIAVEHDAKEAIQIRGEYVTEGSSSNFFIVKNGEIITHPANNLILKGITRNVVEEIANELKLPFVEKQYTLEDVYSADEAFISSTTAEISPVLQINDKTIGQKPGAITRKLQESFNRMI